MRSRVDTFWGYWRGSFSWRGLRRWETFLTRSAHCGNVLFIEGIIWWVRLTGSFFVKYGGTRLRRRIGLGYFHGAIVEKANGV